MKAILLDGSPEGDTNTETAADALEMALRARGCDVTRFVLRDLDLRACTGCFGCWTKTPGQCVIRDAARDIDAGIVNSDIYAIATPVVFGSYGTLAKRALDRSIAVILPFFTLVDGEVHHQKRYERYPDLLVLGTQLVADAEDAERFGHLVERNAINMYNPTHAVEVLAGEVTPEAAQAAAARLVGAPKEVAA